MDKIDLEQRIISLKTAIEQSAASHNSLVGRHQAYQEMLAKITEEELNCTKEEEDADQEQSAESVPALSVANVSKEV